VFPAVRNAWEMIDLEYFSGSWDYNQVNQTSGIENRQLGQRTIRGRVAWPRAVSYGAKGAVARGARAKAMERGKLRDQPDEEWGIR
jgi:hypothetical protein